MTGPVPDGVPSLLKVGQVAAVLGMGERTVKGWLDSGALVPVPVHHNTHSRARWVRAADVAAFADRCGLVPSWGVLGLD